MSSTKASSATSSARADIVFLAIYSPPQRRPEASAALTAAIDQWASHWNHDPKPFVWHTPAKKIIAKVRQGRAALTHQIKSATHH